MVRDEKDFALKAAMRAVLWAQGYTTRIDVLLAYDLDPRGRRSTGKAGLTDLDVLGFQMNPGFHVHTVVADCKTSPKQIPERLFWLAGVSRFFQSDTNFLVRSSSLPEHAVPLARSLDISLVSKEDLTILYNTFVTSNGEPLTPALANFFAPELLDEVLRRVAELPDALRPVALYREATYWMEPAHVQLQRVVGALNRLGKGKGYGRTHQLVFADFVWLYVIALWKACAALTRGGLSRLEQGLKLYLSGNENGLQNLERMHAVFETIAHRYQLEAALPIFPAYFTDLHELFVRLVRRPSVVAQMGRRAEWLLVGQLVGNLGPPPWPSTYETELCDKLLGDIAQFLVHASRLPQSFLDGYMDALVIAAPPLASDVRPDIVTVRREEVEVGSDELAAETLRNDAQHVVDDTTATPLAKVSDDRRSDEWQQSLPPVVAKGEGQDKPDAQ